MEISRGRDRLSPAEEYSLIYGGIGIIILLAARFLPLSYFPILCPFKTITGIPCPTCGGIRSIVHLTHLNLIGAFCTNPLISALIILGIIFLIYSVTALILRLSGLRLMLNLSQVKQREKMAIRLGAIGAIILNWLYLIIAGI